MEKQLTAIPTDFNHCREEGYVACGIKGFLVNSLGHCSECAKNVKAATIQYEAFKAMNKTPSFIRMALFNVPLMLFLMFSFCVTTDMALRAFPYIGEI